MTILELIAAASLAVVSVPQDPATDLKTLLEEIWQFELAEDPLFATSVGEHRFNDRLPSVSAADEARRTAQRRSFLERLESIARDQLGPVDVVSYDMMERNLRDALRSFDFRTYEMPFTADWGFHMGLARLPQSMPMLTTQDYEHYLARLREFPRYVSQQIDNMRSGLARGFSQPAAVLGGYDATIAAHVVDDPEASVFWMPFVEFPSQVPPDDHRRLREEGRSAIMESAVVAFRDLLEFWHREYLPNARETLGASELPNGAAYYDYLIEHFTTLNLSAEEVHEIGLAEVARIREEMEAIIDEVGFPGDFDAFLEFLRTDPHFYAGSAELLIREASYLAKQMDAKLPSLFKTLPRLPYGVAPVPEEIAPKFTSGRYISSSPGSTEPGYYWVNTYDLRSRPLYALPALTLHEAVPGHHLQFALTQELTDLPPFRRAAYVNAFGEGWGLYSEWLGIEAGMYTSPYTRFGRLTYEMWRACRLVVDTGVHAFGWTRQEVIEYLSDNTALSIHEITTETDRYISWPGQALSYKMGELTIRRLRQRAETALGEEFDVREFHDVVLGSGTVPLTVLEDQVNRWIEAQDRTF